MKMEMKKIDFKKSGQNIKYVLIGVCGILAISSIIMTIETATSSAEVASLQKEEATLADQKMSLENSLVKSLSMGELQTQSAEMGFVKPGTLVYVAPAQNVARLP
jgi:hypothetical protein